MCLGALTRGVCFLTRCERKREHLASQAGWHTRVRYRQYHQLQLPMSHTATISCPGVRTGAICTSQQPTSQRQLAHNPPPTVQQPSTPAPWPELHASHQTEVRCPQRRTRVEGCSIAPWLRKDSYRDWACNERDAGQQWMMPGVPCVCDTCCRRHA